MQDYVLTLLINVFGRGWLRPPSTMGQWLPRRGGPSGHRTSPLVRIRGPLPTLATALSSPPEQQERGERQLLSPRGQCPRPCGWRSGPGPPLRQARLWAPPASPALCPPATGGTPEASLDLCTFHFLLVPSRLSSDHLLPALPSACSGADPDPSHPL